MKTHIAMRHFSKLIGVLAFICLLTSGWVGEKMVTENPYEFYAVIIWMFILLGITINCLYFGFRKSEVVNRLTA